MDISMYWILLESEASDMIRCCVATDALRELAWSGVPPFLRPTVWRLLLVSFWLLIGALLFYHDSWLFRYGYRLCQEASDIKFVLRVIHHPMQIEGKQLWPGSGRSTWIACLNTMIFQILIALKMTLLCSVRYMLCSDHPDFESSFKKGE